MKTGTRLLILCLLAPAALAENMSLRSGRKDGGSGAQKEGGRSQEGGR